MFFRRDIAKHRCPVPADHRRTDCAGDVVVAGRDVGGEWAERVEGRFVAPLELFLHVLLDHVHGDVTGAFVHHLDVLRPRALREFALSVKFGELGLVVCVSNTAWPQAVADGKADVVRGHDFADLVPMPVEKTFLMMRETPLAHNRPAPRYNPRPALTPQPN